MSRHSRYTDRTAPRTETCEATCRDCDWCRPTDHRGLGYLQDRVRHHVATQHHRVVVRRSCVTVYRPKETA